MEVLLSYQLVGARYYWEMCWPDLFCPPWRIQISGILLHYLGDKWKFKIHCLCGIGSLMPQWMRTCSCWRLNPWLHSGICRRGMFWFQISPRIILGSAIVCWRNCSDGMRTWCSFFSTSRLNAEWNPTKLVWNCLTQQPALPKEFWSVESDWITSSCCCSGDDLHQYNPRGDL